MNRDQRKASARFWVVSNSQQNSILFLPFDHHSFSLETTIRKCSIVMTSTLTSTDRKDMVKKATATTLMDFATIASSARTSTESSRLTPSPSPASRRAKSTRCDEKDGLIPPHEYNGQNEIHIPKVTANGIGTKHQKFPVKVSSTLLSLCQCFLLSYPRVQMVSWCVCLGSTLLFLCCSNFSFSLSFFVKQLMQLVDCDEFDHIISWTADGGSFVIHKPMTLVERKDGSAMPHIISGQKEGHGECDTGGGPKFKSFLRKVRTRSSLQRHIL